jgi:hypothetical protein
MFSGGGGICGIKGPPFFSLFYFVDGGVLLQSGKQTNKQSSKLVDILCTFLPLDFLPWEDLVSGAPLCILTPNKISCTSVMFFLFCFVLSVCAFSGSEAMLSGYGDFPSVPQSLILLIFSKG